MLRRAWSRVRQVVRREPLLFVVLFLLITLLVLSGIPSLSLQGFRPVGEGPAGPPVPAQAFGHIWTKRPVLLLGLGDSITAGFGARPGRSYFDLLKANPPDDAPEMKGVNLSTVFPKLRAVNRAVSASTSLDHLRGQVERLEVASPDTLGIVVITTGGNDIIHNYGRTPPREGAMYGATLAQAQPWIDAYETRLEQILDGIEARFPGGCHIFLGNIYDPTDDVGDAENAGLPAWPDGLAIHRAYNKIIADCAKARPNVHLVNIHDAFLGHGIHCTERSRKHYRADDPHYWYYENLEDPNERGYDAIRRLFLLEIARHSESLSAGR